jgi:tRNA pseudouridine38-40 synthase
VIKNFKITIEYDGTRYHGWQRQKNDPTVQEEIEKALKTMTGNRITLTGSGRTDAGVHAFSQVANFHCDTELKPEAFLRGLNSILPEDIVITACNQVDDKFHARYDVKSKTYLYRILNRPMPAAISRHYAWFIQKKLDLTSMRSALSHLIGRHNFKAFEGSGSPRSHTVRRVSKADLFEEDDGYLVFEIEADGFLRSMVRNIVGTLVGVGLAKITPEDFKGIIESKDRSQAGATAPAHGLFLKKVSYR